MQEACKTQRKSVASKKKNALAEFKTRAAKLYAQNWIDLHPAEYWIPDVEPRKETISYDDLRLATDSKWMMEHGLEISLKQKDLLGVCRNGSLSSLKQRQSDFPAEKA